MSELDLVVRGGTVVRESGRQVQDVGVRDGRIVELGRGLRGRREIDADGAFVLPGLIDPHVHLCAPEVLAADEPEFVDDFHTGSLAALAGGVTTFGQMSFPLADEGPEAAVARDLRACEVEAAADHFFHPGVLTATEGTAAEVARLASAGHTSLKIVMLAFDWDHSHLVDVVRTAGDSGMLTLAHCEDHAMIEHATQRLVDAGQGDVAHYPQSRPVVSERAAVERLVAIGELTGAPVYVVHLSSAEALEVTRSARARDLAVHVETRPLYLGLTDEVHAEPDGARYVGMPPVRSAADVAALWAGIADGSVDTIGSDHAPWTLEQKLEHADDLHALRKGVAEIETMLPLLWTEGVQRGRVSVEDLVRVTATGPARLFGLEGKGAVEVGLDADLVVVDPDASRVVDGSTMHSRAGYSVYDGRTLGGFPRWTISRGDVVAEDGVADAAPGRGRHVRRRPWRRS